MKHFTIFLLQLHTLMICDTYANIQRAGNCDMKAFNATTGQNWLIPMLSNYTRCELHFRTMFFPVCVSGLALSLLITHFLSFLSSPVY